MRRNKYEIGERIRDRICLSQIAGWFVELVIPMAVLFAFLKYVTQVPFMVAVRDLWQCLLGIFIGWTIIRLIILKHLFNMWDRKVEQERKREYEEQNN